MNRTRIAALALLLAVSLSSAAAALAARAADAPPAGYAWKSDLASALAEARATGRDVVADFGAVWCAECHQLDRVTLSDSATVAFGKDFVWARIDGDRDTALVHQRHVMGYPTLIVMNAEGAEYDRVVGFMPPADFRAQVADYRAGRGTLAALLADEGAHRGESAYLMRLADRLYGHGRTGEAIPRYRAVFADGASSDAPRAGFFLARLAARSGRSAEALATVDTILARFPTPDVRMHVTPLEAELSEKLGNRARALAAWRRFVAENPGDEFVKDAQGEIARLEKAGAAR